jgi:hypothetical protein
LAIIPQPWMLVPAGLPCQPFPDSAQNQPRPQLRAELVVNQQPSYAESAEQQQENNVPGIRAVLQYVIALSDGQREHQNHDDQIESLVHKRSFPEKGEGMHSDTRHHISCPLR